MYDQNLITNSKSLAMRMNKRRSEQVNKNTLQENVVINPPLQNDKYTNRYTKQRPSHVNFMNQTERNSNSTLPCTPQFADGVNVDSSIKHELLVKDLKKNDRSNGSLN